MCIHWDKGISECLSWAATLQGQGPSPSCDILQGQDLSSRNLTDKNSPKGQSSIISHSSLRADSGSKATKSWEMKTP